MRPPDATRGQHESRIAARGRKPDEVHRRQLTEIVFHTHPTFGRPAQRDDARPVRRPDRVGVEARHPADGDRGTAARGDLPQRARRAVPRDVGEPVSVRGPCRLELRGVRFGNSVRRGAWKLRNVQLGEGRERHTASVGRWRRALDQSRSNRSRLYPSREIEPRAERLLDPRAKRNRCRCAAVDFDAVERPCVGHDQCRAVRGERVPRQQVASEARLLFVALDRINQPALRTAGQITQLEPRCRFMARPEDEARAVRREARPKGAARRLRQHVLVTGERVTARDLPHREVGVVREPSTPHGVEDVPAVGRNDHAERVVPLGVRGLGVGLGLRDPHTGSALHVVAPQLVSTQAPSRA